jgi:hypothetical protein
VRAGLITLTLNYGWQVLHAIHHRNMCCVIGLQATGESAINHAGANDPDELDEFVSAPQMVLRQLVQVGAYARPNSDSFDANRNE